MIKAPSLNRRTLRQAFETGHFYSSTGAELEEYSLSSNSLKLSINVLCEQVATFEFFGNTGKLLYREVGTSSEYKFKGDEMYVRVRIGTTSGTWLWTQPIFLDTITDQMEWINS